MTLKIGEHLHEGIGVRIGLGVGQPHFAHGDFHPYAVPGREIQAVREYTVCPRLLPRLLA
jgi:hypothetical protein